MNKKKWQFPVSGDGWIVVLYCALAMLAIGLCIDKVIKIERTNYVIELVNNDPVHGKHLRTDDGRVCLDAIEAGGGTICYPLVQVKRWYSVEGGDQ